MVLKYMVLGLCLLCGMNLKAQCKVENQYFQTGEVLTYDMYFKYGILYTKAGTSSLSVTDDTYAGNDAYRMTLEAKSGGIAKSFFSMSDTLSSWMTKKLVPLAYAKDAHENGDYTNERAVYTYLPEGGVSLRNINIRNEKLRYDTTLVSDNCMYDMLSIVYYARTLEYATMKKGDKKTVSFFSGRKKVDMDIEYHGVEKVSANDGKKYNCIKLVLMMNERAFEDKNEAMKVFITNDYNRIPVRIDSKLKVGSTRAVLKAYKGQRN
ncbi:DUF3108 domain-containing protein [Parabacteroides sp. 52]|nr:DUF3108 domain-containing protein [Parabacteroides sp. 52]